MYGQSKLGSQLARQDTGCVKLLWNTLGSPILATQYNKCISRDEREW